MSQLGVGAMLHHLSGGSQRSATDFYGRKVVNAELRKGDNGSSRWTHSGQDALVLSFEDGTGMALLDDGQSCCESRYITCDDDLRKIIGGVLIRIEEKDTENTEGEDGAHEQVFIEVATSECFVTVCTHNEHNGYYGGFGLTLEEIPTSGSPSAEVTG